MREHKEVLMVVLQMNCLHLFELGLKQAGLLM